MDWSTRDGSLAGLYAWTGKGDWRSVRDIDRAAAYRHTREKVLTSANRVAEIAADTYQAQHAVAADALGHAIRTR